jgi:diguanylate cyclase
MRLNFNALPTLVALAILAAVFAAISRQHTKERVKLWLIGWALVLLRSLVQFAHFRGPTWGRFEVSIGLSAMVMASIAFVASVAPQAVTRARQWALVSVLGFPVLIYTNAMIWEVSAPSLYYALVVLGFIASMLLLWEWYRRVSFYIVSMALASLALAALMIGSIAAGKDEYSVHFMLASLNLFAGGLYWYHFQRPSAGVLSTVFGFAAWGATYPVGLLLATRVPPLPIGSEVWNIPKYLVAVGMIVTLLENQIRETEHLAYHDALTGLPNRRLLQDRLLQALAHANRTGHKVAVLLLDLDDFKEVNDTFGHRIGDAALQQVVARLSSRMRASDTLARTGGDEFTVVSEVTAAQGAQALASALESALVLPLKVEGTLVRTGVSVGYAVYPEDGTDPGDLYAAADHAMYASKRGMRALWQANGEGTV